MKIEQDEVCDICPAQYDYAKCQNMVRDSECPLYSED